MRNGTSALLGVALYLRVQDITWTRPKFALRPRAMTEALVTGAGVVVVFLWNFWLNTGIPIVGHHLPALAKFVYTVGNRFPLIPEHRRPLIAA